MLKQSNEDLIKLIKSDIDTKENYEKLYTQNRGFIFLIVRKRVHGIYEIDDLMQQAFLALVRAVEYYDDTKKETNFLTLLKYCIWNEIRDLTCDIPAHMQAKIIKYRMTYDKLYNDLGLKPKAYQVMLEMNISIKELELIRAAMRTPLSLDEPLKDDSDTTRMDLYADSEAGEDTDFDSSLEKQDLKRIILEALNKLPVRSQEVISKRYFQSITLEQCGYEMNITRERVRQIESKAFRILRKDYGLKRKVVDYTSISEYKSVGVNSFNSNHTSSTELLVLRREQMNKDLRKIGIVFE